MNNKLFQRDVAEEKIGLLDWITAASHPAGAFGPDDDDDSDEGETETFLTWIQDLQGTCFRPCCWEYPNLLLPCGGWVMKCSAPLRVLWSMWMVFPNQAGSLQDCGQCLC